MNGVLVEAAIEQTPQGELTVENLAPGVVRTRIVGFAPLAFAQRILDFYGPVVRQHPDGLWCLHDWSEATGYDSDARRVMIEWNREHRSDFHRIDVLFRSSLIGMGVKVTALFIPMLHPTSNPAEFSQQQQHAITSRSGS
ncbi:MAG: hypothetical protein AAFX94_08815 [Myxococcota bacterium]